MKKILTPALLLFAMVLTITSCKKDEESSNNTTPAPTPALTKTEILTGNYYWKMTAATVNPAVLSQDGNLINDLYSGLPACQNDNLYKFNTDFSFITDEGPTKCNIEDPQTSISDWAWNSNQTILTIEGYDYDLVDLTSSTLKVKFIESGFDADYNPVTYTIILTYTKQ